MSKHADNKPAGKRVADVALAVGHDAFPGQEGAQSAIGPTECYFWRWWARSIAREIRGRGLIVRIVQRRESVEGWTARQLDAAQRAARSRLVIDLHFNAGGYPGSNAIYRPGSEPSQRIAEDLAQAIAEAQSTRYRGVYDSAGVDGLPRSWAGSEVESPDGRWYPAGSELTILSRTEPALAVIIEPFDGSVEADYRAGVASLLTGRTQRAIADVVQSVLGR